MPKNMRLLLSFIGLVLGIFYLNKLSDVKSKREEFLKNVFSIDSQVTDSWQWEDKKWSFFHDFKSQTQRNGVWYFLLSTSTTTSDTNQYSLVLYKDKKAQQSNWNFLSLPKTENVKFEIKKISDKLEALFFTEKKCQTDFCSENLKIFSIYPEDFKEIGNISLSASNLLTCKKDKKPCFEFFGTHLLQTTKTNSVFDIKVSFKGFEEDPQGKAKSLDPEKYIFENGKYISETFKKYH